LVQLKLHYKRARLKLKLASHLGLLVLDQQIAQNLNVQKTALGQLKQLNPDINPQKAAMAATKDLATMNPQEKEVLAQVAKTLSPALGSPAFGSIKTALQKAKNT